MSKKILSVISGWMIEGHKLKKASLRLIQLNKIMPILLLQSTQDLYQFCTHSDVRSL